MAKPRNITIVEAMLAFQSPCLVHDKQERLSVVCDGLTVTVDYNCRIVILRPSGPIRGYIDPFGIPNNDVGIVLERSRASPQRADARAGRF